MLRVKLLLVNKNIEQNIISYIVKLPHAQFRLHIQTSLFSIKKHGYSLSKTYNQVSLDSEWQKHTYIIDYDIVIVKTWWSIWRWNTSNEFF